MLPDQQEPDAAERRASLFRYGRNQAVRIPREFEMEGTEVLLRKEGERLIRNSRGATEQH